MSKTRFTTIALVLAMATTVHAQTYKVLYNFGSNPGDPSGPVGTIAQSPGGNLYTTAYDGSAFKLGTNGTVTVIHHFNNESDGYGLLGGLTFATDQRFHGTTQGGGLYNSGTIFRITPDGKLTTVHSFKPDEGGIPYSAPIQSVSGYFYGTASAVDSSNSLGAIYKITNDGEFTILHQFDYYNDGAWPIGSLIQGSDYGFYGTTRGGGKYLFGTIFRVSSQGYFKTLYHFDGPSGANGNTPLIQAKDGNFYGETTQGGASGVGVIFKLTPPSFTYTVLHEFNGGSDGGAPYGGLVEASDGNLYGTDLGGGANGAGVAFRITPSGVFTVLHDFERSTGSDPEATLIQHTNGFLYGGTGLGGSADKGVFFRLDLGLPPFVTFLTVYGRVGAHVVILGQHFTNESVVSFNGVPAENPEIHPTYIKAIVPDGATTGDITVTTTSGTLTSNKVFVVH